MLKALMATLNRVAKGWEIRSTQTYIFAGNSNFKCTNHDDNDDENVEFMFENVIKAHNMLIDVNDVLEFVPKANQEPLHSAQTAAGLCLCIGKCRFKSFIGSHAGDYGFIPL